MLKPFPSRSLRAGLQRVPKSRSQCQTIRNSVASITFSNNRISSLPFITPHLNGVQHYSTITISNATVDEIQTRPIPGILIRTIPDNDQSIIYIKAFNKSVIQASRALYDDKSRESLWHSYLAAKQNVPTFVHLVPYSAWNRLWKTQSSFRPQDTDRL